MSPWARGVVAFMLLSAAGAARGGSPAAPAPANDAPMDRPPAESRACAPQGRLCVRLVDDQLRFSDGAVHPVPAGADRVAVSDTGWVAFVAPRGGWPSVHVMSPQGHTTPLTNLGLARTPGRAPDGYVPPPVREGDLHFDGEALAWALPDGTSLRIAVPAMGHGAQP